MATAHHAESYVQEFAGELDRWQNRIENLKRMAEVAAAKSRADIEAGIRRIEGVLRVARDLLGRTQPISAEEWMQIHPKVTAILRAAQYCYNNLVSDWPQL